jgi:hypothetical protein
MAISPAFLKISKSRNQTPEIVAKNHGLANTTHVVKIRISLDKCTKNRHVGAY